MQKLIGIRKLQIAQLGASLMFKHIGIVSLDNGHS